MQDPNVFESWLLTGFVVALLVMAAVKFGM